MNMRLLYCGLQEDFPNIAVESKLTAVFDVYSGKYCPIEKCRDFKELLSALSTALVGEGITVVFAGKSDYDTVKRSLIRAIHLKCELSIDVLNALDSEMNSVEKELHSIFPVGAKIFSTEDGRYSSFACRSGKQYLIFCPMAGKYVETVENDIALWLAKYISRPTGDSEPYIKMFRCAAGILKSHNISAAVAATKTVDFIRTPASVSGRAGDCVKFSSKPVAKCDCEPQEHTARAALRAAFDCNTVIGMAMSNIFVLKKNGYEQYVVYIAVSCDNDVTVSRVYSGNTEITDFLKKAACELFSLLSATVEKMDYKSDDDGFDVF